MTNEWTRRAGWASRAAAVALAVGAAGGEAWGQTPGCDALAPERQQAKREAFAALYPYDGCDETFERCLAKKPAHPVVLRLASDVCRHVKAGKARGEIERLLAKRAQSMLPTGKPASFSLDEGTAAGEAQAPVRVVVYACARCPFCKVLVPGLYQEVTQGKLRGKVRLYLRPFPLKDHAGSSEGGLAMLGAAQLGQFWPFVTRMYERYDTFCPKLLPEWASEAGMVRAAFEEKIADPLTREALVAAKQEGIRNKVEATPTLFIDGRKYVYEPQLEAVVDVLLEAHEAAALAKAKP